MNTRNNKREQKHCQEKDKEMKEKTEISGFDWIH